MIQPIKFPEFAARIVAGRKLKKMSTQELAAYLSTSVYTVKHWEDGICRPSNWQTLANIADLYGVSLRYLMLGPEKV
jgi:DNA-binding transcriptional regulator YiaG